MSSNLKGEWYWDLCRSSQFDSEGTNSANRWYGLSLKYFWVLAEHPVLIEVGQRMQKDIFFDICSIPYRADFTGIFLQELPKFTMEEARDPIDGMFSTLITVVRH